MKRGKSKSSKLWRSIGLPFGAATAHLHVRSTLKGVPTIYAKVPAAKGVTTEWGEGVRPGFGNSAEAEELLSAPAAQEQGHGLLVLTEGDGVTAKAGHVGGVPNVINRADAAQVLPPAAASTASDAQPATLGESSSSLPPVTPSDPLPFVVRGPITLWFDADGVLLAPNGEQLNDRTITGRGDVTVCPAGVLGGPSSIRLLLKVDLSGGRLIFGARDHNDTVVLLAGSFIRLGGGALVVDDGTLDVTALSHADDFYGISGLLINSTLVLTISQLRHGLVDRAEISGNGMVAFLKNEWISLHAE